MTSSSSEYWFLSSVLLSFNGRSLPQHGKCKPECTVLLLILIAAAPGGASNRTLGLADSPRQFKNTLLTASKTVLVKYDLPRPPLPKRNQWIGVDCFEVVPHLTLTCVLSWLYIKSNICLCLRFRDLILLLISVLLKMIV